MHGAVKNETAVRLDRTGRAAEEISEIVGFFQSSLHRKIQVFHGRVKMR